MLRGTNQSLVAGRLIGGSASYCLSFAGNELSAGWHKPEGSIKAKGKDCARFSNQEQMQM